MSKKIPKGSKGAPAATHLTPTNSLVTPPPAAAQPLAQPVHVPIAASAPAASAAAVTTGAAPQIGGHLPHPHNGPLPVQLFRNTPDPASDPFTAYYLMVRSASDFLSYNNFEAFVTAVLGTKPLPQGLPDLPPYEKLVYIAHLFVACHGQWVKNCFQSAAGLQSVTSKFLPPNGTQPVGDMDEANRIFHPFVLDINQLAAQALELFDATPHGGTSRSPASDAYTLVQKLIEMNPRVPHLPQDQIDLCAFDGFVQYKLENPCMTELIWNYWLEEGMLVQGINAITLRFQNRLYPGGDKLARCNISHLRPLTNLLWDYVQHEPDRLSLARRAYEYDHQYGLRLRGSAVPNLMPADSRTSFLEAFHRVLQEACRYYRTSMDTTMHADAFPMLNCLRELHLILAEGSDNQYSDMPTTARSEMLLQQLILARPEIHDFLGGKPGVPYAEAWMPHIDTLRQIMGWNDASIRHYQTLATCGEMILLGIRHLNWSDIKDSSIAANWLTACRPEVQNYVHSYRAVTGVDLGVFDTPVVAGKEWTVQPSDLINRRRLAVQQPRLPQ